jgi:hypothetical protein
MYTRYMKNILVKLAGAQIGCNIGGMVMNVLAHADYTVLLAPAWRAMQRLLDVLPTEVCIINMECNVGKTMCMVFFS